MKIEGSPLKVGVTKKDWFTTMRNSGEPAVLSALARKGKG
jgi:hypothetical protein